MSAPDQSMCSSNDELIADHCLLTFAGHNARPSRAVDKSRMVAVIDAELRDEEGDPIPEKGQRAPQARKAVPKRKRNNAGDEESDPNDDNFAASGEGSEDSTSDDELVIISNVEVCLHLLNHLTHL